MQRQSTYDAVVVGAGFAGLYMLHVLRDRLGLSVLGVEANADVGGTWYMNRYPGARCDTEAYIYSYSFSDALLEEWDWSGKYPLQSELLSYFDHVANKFDLRRSFLFGTRVVSAHLQETGRWKIHLDSGEDVETRYFVTGVGVLASAPFTPQIPNLDDYGGQWVHTGMWPKSGIDYEGKSVAVIGTGSTGVQVVPALAEQAAEVFVLQRSPQFTIPARHDNVDRAFLEQVKENYDEIWETARWSVGGFPWQHNGRSALADGPDERREVLESLWADGGLKFVFGSYKDLLTDDDANALVSEFVREKMRERIVDPQLRAKLVPTDHPFGSRRPIVDTDYLETYEQDHVHLVDLREEPLQTFTATGLRTAKRDIDADVVVFATGFDAVTGPFFRMDIRGRDGILLTDKWSDGPATLYGLMTSGFPNMFMVTGPGSMFGNHPVMVEHHVEWIADCIAGLEDSASAQIEPDPSAEADWKQHIQDVFEQTVVSRTPSWWSGANVPGKKTTPLFYLGSYGHYRRTCNDEAARGYPHFATK